MARVKGKQKKHIKMINTWRSYSDMMSGLFILFVLVMLVFLIQAQKNYQLAILEREDKAITQEQYTAALKSQSSKVIDRDALLNSLNERLASKDLTLEELQIALEQQAELLDQKEDALYVRTQEMNSNQEFVEEIIGLKAEMIKELKAEFEKEGVNINIDDDTGAMTLDADVLYAYNDDVLAEEGKAVLYEVLPIYCRVLLNDKNLPNVAEIVIDGYTDDQGSFEYNMGLSQRRALSVMNYLLEISKEWLDEDGVATLQGKLSANGHSFNNLIYDENGEVDADASRRVEVKFRLRDDEMLNELSRIFSESAGEVETEAEVYMSDSIFGTNNGDFIPEDDTVDNSAEANPEANMEANVEANAEANAGANAEVENTSDVGVIEGSVAEGTAEGAAEGNPQ